MEQSYPIFVEETTVRMIWIDADSPEHAAARFDAYTGDYSRTLEKTDPVDSSVRAYPPAEDAPYAWDDVYGYTGGADEPNMHITWHRIHLAEQKRAAHAAAGHPGVTDRVLDGKRWCPECSWWVEIVEKEAR